MAQEDSNDIFPNQPEKGIPDSKELVDEITQAAVRIDETQKKHCMIVTGVVFGEPSQCYGEITEHQIQFPVPVAERHVGGMGGRFAEQAKKLKERHYPGMVFDMCSKCGAVSNLRSE